jgi:hypothetical protein
MGIAALTGLWACAHGDHGSGGARGGDGLTLGNEVVQGAVTFEPGAKEGAVVPEVSSPQLRAVIVEERIEGNRLIERHREWQLDGHVQLLGIPHQSEERVTGQSLEKRAMKAKIREVPREN